jgi:hypothetical protein
MTRASVRTAAVLLAMMSVGGCSFRASVHGVADASTSPPTSASAIATTAGGSPTGSGTRTSQPGSRPAGSTSATPSGPGRCHTGDLAARLAPGSPGAGQRYATLVLTNRGGSLCTVFGFGGLGLVAPGGVPLPTRQVRVRDPAPATVALEPGDSVGSGLHWSVVAGPGEAQTGNCQPMPSTLQVIPPDETEALSVPWGLGPVCEGGTIEQKAYAG